MAKTRHEEPSGFHVGDVIYCGSLRLRGELGEGTVIESTVRAKKGMVLVALLIGEQPISGGENVDVVKVMRQLGWKPLEAEAKEVLMKH